MSEKDLPDVLEIENQGFISPWTESQFLYELNENPVATLMVLTYGEKVIGLWIFGSLLADCMHQSDCRH